MTTVKRSDPNKFQVFRPIFQKKKFLFQNIVYLFFWGGGGGSAAPISPPTALYTSVTDSLSFWLILKDTWPIYHRQSTDTPPTINGQRSGRLSSTHLDWQIDRLLTDILVGISTDARPIWWPIHRSRVGRHVDRCIGRGVHKIHMINVRRINSSEVWNLVISCENQQLNWL